MERYSDNAIEIINELHTERLDYNSEYLPLIDAAQRLAAYENTGLEPEDILSATDMAKVAYALHELNQYKDLGSIARLSELVEACKGLEPSEIAESKLLIATRKDPEKLERMAKLVEADREGRCVVLPCKLGSVVQFRGNPNAEKQTVDCISFYADGKITFGFHEYGMKTTWVDEWGEDDADNYTEAKEKTADDK